MRSRLFLAVLLFACVYFAALTTAAQESATASAAAAASHVVPSLINYNGVLKDATGRTLTSLTGVTFLLYSSEQGGAPLWLETQNVTPDKAGRYTVQLGAASKYGIPPDLFMNGEARWLAAQIGNEAEQSRVLLVAVPYAMKSVDAQTLGGLPPSAFVLAAPPTSGAPAASATTTASSPSSASAPPPATSNVTTTGGTAGTIPMFTTATNIQNAIMTQTGTTAINMFGTLNLPATGTATAVKGFNSQAERYTATAFNSITSTSVPRFFVWMAEPKNNNTPTAAATYNLLSGHGTAAPTETGFKFDEFGHLFFVAGQFFPGVVTKVATGPGLTGGPITSTGTISIDTTKVPLLAAANIFTANQTVNGTLTATSFSGNGASVTNVNAIALGGIAASGYPTLAGVNFFTGFSDFDGTEPVWEVEVSNNGGGYGIISSMNATSGNSAGVYANAPNSALGVGLFGQHGSESTTGKNFSGTFGKGVGVWGDGGGGGNKGILGTVDDGNAGFFENNSPSSWDTLFIRADNSGTQFPLYVFNTSNSSFCDVDSSGNLNCSGAKNAVVPIDGGARTVAMSAIEAPQNWFEDAGSAELVKGVGLVTLDRDFIQTVNTETDYKVFPVPNGDCKGLYVTNKTATSFEVRELGGGTSNVRFDYRIMALRRKYENVRFADHTRDMEHAKAMKRIAIGPPQSHTPNKNLQLAAPRAALRPTATKSQTR